MHRSTPMSLWNQLPVERRRHVGWGIAGVMLSWGIAALMAYIGPTATATMSKRSNQNAEARADSFVKAGDRAP
jgi:hypothetical protein